MPEEKEEEVGKISHYFNKISVATIDVTKGSIKKGDLLHIKGSNTDFTQNIESMQIDSEDVEEAKKGQTIGIKVNERVREGDAVYKVTE